MKKNFRENIDMIILDYVDGKPSIWNLLIKFSLIYVPYVKRKVQSYENINTMLFKYYADNRGS